MWHNRRVLKTSMANGQKTKRWNTCDESRGAPGDERGRTITGLGPGGHDEAEYQHNDRNEADQKGVVITAAVERSSLVVHFREVPRHHDHPRQACECRTSRRRCKRSTEARGSD
jgi:hypothetical protein